MVENTVKNQYADFFEEHRVQWGWTEEKQGDCSFLLSFIDNL